MSKKISGVATVTYAMLEIPDSIKYPQSEDLGSARTPALSPARSQGLQLTQDPIALPSQVLMRPDSCGVRYAESWDQDEGGDPIAQGKRYCQVCLEKRLEDNAVKGSIKKLVAEQEPGTSSPLWEKLIKRLHDANYELPESIDRPDDFNVFHDFGEAKEYIGLIYAVR